MVSTCGCGEYVNVYVGANSIINREPSEREGDKSWICSTAKLNQHFLGGQIAHFHD